MGFKVLLVEDNKDICEVSSYLLQKMGHTVTTAANGLEGFEMFKKRQFDVIIIDIFMPVMDGNELIAKLAEFSDLPPIIALSYNIFDIKPSPIITSMGTKPMTSVRLGELVMQAFSLRRGYSTGRQDGYQVS